MQFRALRFAEIEETLRPVAGPVEASGTYRMVWTQPDGNTRSLGNLELQAGQVPMMRIVAGREDELTAITPGDLQTAGYIEHSGSFMRLGDAQEVEIVAEDFTHPYVEGVRVSAEDLAARYLLCDYSRSQLLSMRGTPAEISTQLREWHGLIAQEAFAFLSGIARSNSLVDATSSFVQETIYNAYARLLTSNSEESEYEPSIRVPQSVWSRLSVEADYACPLPGGISHAQLPTLNAQIDASSGLMGKSLLPTMLNIFRELTRAEPRDIRAMGFPQDPRSASAYEKLKRQVMALGQEREVPDGATLMVGKIYQPEVFQIFELDDLTYCFTEDPVMNAVYVYPSEALLLNDFQTPDRAPRL